MTQCSGVEYYFRIGTHRATAYIAWIVLYVAISEYIVGRPDSTFCIIKVENLSVAGSYDTMIDSKSNREIGSHHTI